MPTAVYPGTFDPVTNGHLDLIERGSRLFESLMVLVAENPKKEHLFSAEERVALIRADIAGYENVSVEAWDGLTVEFVRQRGFDAILRGVRTTTDFNLEFQMALTNRSMAPDVETVFVAPNHKWSYLSSSLIREVALSGGDVTPFVSEATAAALAGRVSAIR